MAEQNQSTSRPVPTLTPKQARRVSTPAIAMVVSMLVLLLLVLPFVLLQPRPDGQTYRPQVDVSKEAGYADQVAGFPVADPRLDDRWSANYARWERGDGISSWAAGWITPGSGFIGLQQTDQANPTWLAQQVTVPRTGTRDAAGLQWEVHQGEEHGRPVTAWVTRGLGGTTVILKGTAPQEDFTALAQAVRDSVTAQN